MELEPVSYTPHSIGRDFLLGGHAIFTVANPQGDHYTYRISRKDPEAGSPYTSPAWFVSLLTGPDNLADYSYLGMFQPATGEVRLTKASRYQDSTTPVKVIRWAVGLVLAGKALPAGYAIHHEGRCGRCGRVLTVPESVTTGFGPECATKLGLAA